jgi:nicotinamide N-methyltransferase
MEVEDELVGAMVSPLFGDHRLAQYMMADGRYVICSPRPITCVEETTSNKLFVDHVWPGALVISDFLNAHPDYCFEKSVLELGAGAALPSLVAAKLGAAVIVASDYPEPTILKHIMELSKLNKVELHVLEHVWGESVDNLVDKSIGQGFQLILLAELLWKDTYPLHMDLLKSVVASLNIHGVVLAAFVHRPAEQHTREKDLEFFEAATKHFGLCCTLLDVVRDKYADVDESSLADVYLYRLAFTVGNES